MKKYFFYLNALHVLNDGYKSAFLLLLPFIALQYHLSLTYVGFLATIVNITTPLLAVPSGYFTGKLGGIRVLIISLMLYSLGFIITSFTKSVFFLPITFFVTGIGFGAFHTVSFALVSKFSDRAKRGKIMGEFSAYGEIGRIGLTATVPFLAHWFSWQIACILFGIVGVGFSAFGHFAGIELHEEALSKKVKITSQSSFKTIMKDFTFVLANIAGMVDCFASGSLYIFLPFLLAARHIPLSWLGFFTALFFIGAIASKVIVGPLIDKHGNEKVFILSEIGMTIFILLLTNSSNFVFIIFASFVLGMFTKGTSPIIQTMVARTLEKHGNYEKGFALNNFTISSANVIAPIALGFLADKFGIFTAFNVSALFALLAIIPALGLQWITRQTKEEKLLIVETE